MTRLLTVLNVTLRGIAGLTHSSTSASRSTGLPFSSEVSPNKVPLVHRLAVVYLMLPLVVWLVGWFEWWFGIPAAALLVLGIWPMLRPAKASHSWQTISDSLRLAFRPTTVALLFIAFVWVMATSAGGVFDVNISDWYKLRSILLDLVRHDWPAEPLEDISRHLGVPILLRHYLGYFMVPALMGKWFGPAALNWAVPLWTWCGASLVLLMFTREFRHWKIFVAAIVLISFSGMDIVRVFLLEGWEWFGINLALDGWPRIDLGRSHLEWDRRFGVKLQYSSHMVGMMWVPKHFISAGLYTMLLLQLRHSERFLAVAGILLAAALFWSPFVAIGLLPLALVLLIKQGIPPFLRWQNLLLAPLLGALLIVYLSGGSGGIEQGWVWETQLTTLQEAVVLPIVYLTEFLIIAALLLCLQPKLRTDMFFIACLVTLLLLPLYSFGRNNDWVMRGAMPSLYVLCYYCTWVIAGASVDIKGIRVFRHRATVGLLVMVLAIGAVTPLFELARANNNHNFGVVRYEELGTDHSIFGYIERLYLEILEPEILAMDFPNWYLQLLGFDIAGKALVKGELIAQSDYSVFLNDKTLVFVKEACPLDEYSSEFFVFVTPLNPRDTPESRALENLSFLFRSKHAVKIGRTCIAVRDLKLPFEVGQVMMGQLNAERTAHAWVANYYSDSYRGRMLTEAGEPVVRTNYSVYVHGAAPDTDVGRLKPSRLLYFRAGCSLEETATRYFLHVFPVNATDLPKGRQQAGYEVLDFYFNEFGGRSGGICFAVRELPAYRILGIRTGQLGEGGAAVWESRFDLSE